MNRLRKSRIQFNPHNQTHTALKSLKPKLLTLAIAQALAFQAAQAAGIEVTSNLDDGTDCTLREAIVTVNAGSDQSNGCVIDTGTDPLGTNDTINLAAVAGETITLGGTQLDITQSVTINGANTTVDANNASRVFYVNHSDFLGGRISVNLNSLTITGGNSEAEGGGLFFMGGGGSMFEMVTLTNSTISNNSASAGGGVAASFGLRLTLNNSTISGNTATDGGGVWANGPIIHEVFAPYLFLNNSTISNNTADNKGGGLYAGSPTFASLENSTVSDNSASLGGGIYSYTDLVRLKNSTLSGNTATLDGGGMLATRGSQTDLDNSTVANNWTTSAGSGISVGRDFTFTTITNSIIANNFTFSNPSGPAADCRISGEVTSYVFRINADTITTSDCGTATVADPLLGPLADNGGPTQTHELLAGSPAIDNATGTGATTTDQRSFAAVGTRDSGAYEFGVFDPSDFNPVDLVNNRWTMVGLSKDMPSKTVEDIFGTTMST